MAAAVAAAVRLDVQMITVHAASGQNAMGLAQFAAEETAGLMGNPTPMLLGVTVLTSMNQKYWLETIGIEHSITDQIIKLSQLAQKAGLSGIVCPPQEAAAVRQKIPLAMRIACPGIRLVTKSNDDHIDTMIPPDAIQAGADCLIIGRSIYASPKPAETLRRILDLISADKNEIRKAGAHDDSGEI